MAETKPKKKTLKKRLNRWLFLNVGPYFLYLVSQFVGRTSKWVVVDAEKQLAVLHSGSPWICAFWHSRALLSPFIFKIEGGKRVLVMVSRSEDGIFTAKALKLFGIEAAFGSSTRGGKEALADMKVKHKSENIALAITPDGPLGPAEIVKPGVVALAKETGLAIYALGYYAKKVTRIKSWDRFVLVHPFNTIVGVAGNAIYVPAAAGLEQMEQIRQSVQAEMLRVQEISENWFGPQSKESQLPWFISRVSPWTGKPVWTRPNGERIYPEQKYQV